MTLGGRHQPFTSADQRDRTQHQTVQRGLNCAFPLSQNLARPLRVRCVGAEHTTLPHPVAHLRNRHGAPTRHHLGKAGVVVIHPRLHQALRLLVERRTRIALDLVLAGRDQRGLHAPGSKRLRVVEIRLPDGDRADLATRRDVEL